MDNPNVPLKIQRAEEGEPYLDALYRSLAAPYTSETMRNTDAQRIVQLDYSEVLTIASDDWTPLSNMIGYAEEARDIKHFWMEHRYSKTPQLSYSNEIDDPNPGDAVMPTRYENVLSIQMESFVMSDLAQAIAAAGGLLAGLGPDEFARQMQERLNVLLRNQEMMLIESSYDDTNPVLKFRGLLGNYRDADTTGVREDGWIGEVADGGIEDSTTLDFSGAEIDKDNLESILEDYLLQMRTLQGGGLPDTLFISPRLMKLFKEASAGKIVVNMTQEEVGRRVAFNMGGMIGKFVTAWGMLNIVAHPLLKASNNSAGTGDNDPARSRMLALSVKDIRKIGLRGFGGIRVEPRAKNDQTERRVLRQVYSLEVRKLLSHGQIKNFWVAA